MNISGDVIKRILHWSLTAVTILYLVSGFAITQFRVAQTITFGLLTKPVAFKIHNNLWIPFLVLLALHIFFALRRRAIMKRRRRELSPTNKAPAS